MADIAVSELLHAATAVLSQAGIDRPAAEARLLVAHAAGVDRETLLRDPARRIGAADARGLIDRRAGREPMAHIVGHCGFWTLDLAVTADTLIPRADSETLIEAALATWPDRLRVRAVLDFGTGTGCLLLAALAEFPAAFGIGVDRSAPACRVASRNAAASGLAARCAILCGDWAAPLSARFDLVLSNPPYIPRADIPGLMPEVADHEPHAALDGGADGLDAYRALLPALPALLASDGVAILEIGAGQAPAIAALATRLGFTVDSHRDLGGHERALILRDALPGAGG